MTPAEWQACDDPAALLREVEASASPRRLRLAMCALARRVWALLADALREGVEAAEKYADGAGPASSRVAAWVYYRDGPWNPEAGLAGWPEGYAAHSRQHVAARAVTEDQNLRRLSGFQGWGMARQWHAADARLDCDLLRDVFRQGGPSGAGRSRVTPAAAGLALAAYDERDLPAGTLRPALLTALADRLEAEGVADSEVVAHLRSPGVHVRGCWALDLILNKE